MMQLRLELYQRSKVDEVAYSISELFSIPAHFAKSSFLIECKIDNVKSLESFVLLVDKVLNDVAKYSPLHSNSR